MESFHFKVNLKGMIDLLSNHLYSTPHVYLRELVQNAADAITARKKLDPEHAGRIGVELYESGPRPTLFIEDNGIGLTEEEVHRFLSQIGHTSKQGTDEEDFIGRFGVGLLSCFIVSDEIVLLTRSAKGGDAVEWRGRPDGSYTLRRLESEMAPGTRIYLQAKEGFERWFEPERVKSHIRRYAECLPVPIVFYGEREERLNADKAPWEMSASDALVWAREKLDLAALDVIPLSSSVGEAKGVAFVLPHPVAVSARKTHRVYVKRMLLSERSEKVLPDWAFFVTAVLNVNKLRPTASREEFYEDALLDLTRAELGACIKRYLVNLASTRPKLLKEIIRIHYMSIKMLSLEDDELFRLFIDWLPFETSFGMLTMGELRRREPMVLYTTTVDEFRQIARVAKAQSICVVNGGYVHDAELVQKLGKVFPEIQVRRLDPAELTNRFSQLDERERAVTEDFLDLAGRMLRPFACVPEIRKFAPPELSALYITGEEAQFLRAAEQTREEANELFSSLIGQVTGQNGDKSLGRLCFNFANPVVRKAILTRDLDLRKAAVAMLYVQALLLGHHPLRKQEMDLLNHGIIHLLDRGLELGGNRDEPDHR
ncbi:HSP90 family protein [Staphylospora marina]|uniref:HSP90 family protein n=1 Tax=Staphylospora marina TaxID=2490858 RepID=UPI000F5BCD3C|nr:HSP90 family protein [Staphylospora marina]